MVYDIMAMFGACFKVAITIRSGSDEVIMYVESLYCGTCHKSDLYRRFGTVRRLAVLIKVRSNGCLNVNALLVGQAWCTRLDWHVAIDE